MARRVFEELKEGICKRRPPKVRGKVKGAIRELLHASPKEYGLNEDRWSAPLIGYILYNSHGLLLSESTIRRMMRSFSLTYSQ